MLLDTLVALDLVQRHMKAQFEVDMRPGAKARRADREHRSRFRVAGALAMRVLVRPKQRRSASMQRACPENSSR